MTCEIFSLATGATCTRDHDETVTARCRHGHTSTKPACRTHAQALRDGCIACRACHDAGHACDMTITS